MRIIGANPQFILERNQKLQIKAFIEAECIVFVILKTANSNTSKE